MSKVRSDVHPGAIFSTNNFGNIMVLEVKDTWNVTVAFLEHFCIVNVSAGNIRNGGVKNPMKPSVYGVGFIGIGPYKAWNGRSTKAYAVWTDMLRRVYAPPEEFVRRVYEGTSVHSHWHNFQNFAHWYYRKLEPFGVVDFKWHLDKDLLVPGNRQYGPETCCVIPHTINVLFTDHAFGRGNYPLGVSSQNGRRFQTVMTTSGKYTFVGSYETIAEAQLAYWKRKFKAIQKTTIQYWQYLPEPLAFRLLTFGWKEAHDYYGEDAVIWHGR